VRPVEGILKLNRGFLGLPARFDYKLMSEGGKRVAFVDLGKARIRQITDYLDKPVTIVGAISLKGSDVVVTAQSIRFR
jgi:hypothetical protein